MKMMNKCQIVDQSATALYWEERNIMASARSDWIVHLHYAFQDEKYLYLVMDFVPGGDLATVMLKVRRWPYLPERRYATSRRA